MNKYVVLLTLFMSDRTNHGRSALDRLDSSFSTMTWVLIPTGVGINVVGGILVNVLKLPLFLDTIGTILIALVAGPWTAAITGILTNTVEGILINPTYIPYGVTNMMVGIVAGYLARRGWFHDLKGRLGVVAALTITGIVTSAPITVMVFGGFTGTGADVVTGFFMATGQNIIQSVLAQEAFTEPLDKLVNTFVAFYLAQSLPRRYRPANAELTLPTGAN